MAASIEADGYPESVMCMGHHVVRGSMPGMLCSAQRSFQAMLLEGFVLRGSILPPVALHDSLDQMFDYQISRPGNPLLTFWL